MTDLGITTAPVEDAAPTVAASGTPPTKRPPRKLVSPDERSARIRALLTEALGCVNEALEVLDGRHAPAGEDTDPENQSRDVLRARASLLRALATPEQIEAEFQAAITALAAANSCEDFPLKAAVIELALQLDPYATPGLDLVPAGENIDELGKRARPTRSRTPRRTPSAPVDIVRAGLALSSGQAVR